MLLHHRSICYDRDGEAVVSLRETRLTASMDGAEQVVGDSWWTDTQILYDKTAWKYVPEGACTAMSVYVCLPMYICIRMYVYLCIYGSEEVTQFNFFLPHPLSDIVM